MTIAEQINASAEATMATYRDLLNVINARLATDDAGEVLLFGHRMDLLIERKRIEDKIEELKGQA